jgi:hypothetical protein
MDHSEDSENGKLAIEISTLSEDVKANLRA